MHTVLLEDGSTGKTGRDVSTGDLVTITSRDENGSTIKIRGRVADILETDDTARPHGNTGKKNALRGDKPLSAQIVVRCPSDLKSRAEKAASDRGISASQLYVSAIERYLAD
ncbi:MAG: hypothetical protein WC322_02735 [Candidatus Paceibacterota bacterium]|jgi:hypothetical protein